MNVYSSVTSPSFDGLVVLLQGGSAIRSNANLAVYGQGLLRLEGPGDFIIAQRLFVSLFFNVFVSVAFDTSPLLLTKLDLAYI